ncbi:lipoprotein YvcA [Bacillus sp. CLL-7-23]|uniref:Lipoprotein YvcA n=1 Tax=Bacillus changyiensis TaxID=3004103 RepID=A0ABT4WYZ5_9BACI|nr:lipoprotein YvcA [Bacillus changyiensis]MDA7025263.1 lipoprotein YvcA [Bacillus changyiensis]
MKKLIIICFTFMLVVTGGCSMNENQNGKEDKKTEAVKPIDMDPKDLPKVPAFQDEKTREYMTSTKEVEPGYYLLESKMKGFTMLFPEDAKISRLTYNDGEFYETIEFDSYEEKTNIQLNGEVTYYRKKSFVENKETLLDTISEQNGYKGNFEKSSEKGKEIYFASMKDIFKDIKRKYNFSYSYIGFIKSTNEKYLGVEYNFTFGCLKDDQPCSLNEKETRKKAKKMINSITFNIKKKEQKDDK